MSEWSDFHRGIRRQRWDILGGPDEIIRKEIIYRGLLLQRTDPNQGHMWTISDLGGKDVAGLGGAFTKLQLAQEAVDRHIKHQEETEKEFSETAEENN
jgi:hypothetical protein